MRKVLLMVFAVGMFMALGSAGAMASSKSGSSSKDKHCPKGQERGKNGKCVKPTPKPCAKGEERGKDGKCVKPTPKPCAKGEERGKDGKCVKPTPKPVECDKDEIKTDKGCVPRPKAGPCSKADLVLLEDLLKGTGGLLCVYLGNNAPNADEDRNCPKATLALPIDNLVGACLYLPPVEIDDDKGGSSPKYNDGGYGGSSDLLPALPILSDGLNTGSLTVAINALLKLK